MYCITTIIEDYVSNDTIDGKNSYEIFYLTIGNKCIKEIFTSDLTIFLVCTII